MDNAISAMIKIRIATYICGKARYIFNLCVSFLISRFTLYGLISSVAHPFVNSWYSFINSATQALSLLSLPQNPYACMTALSLA